MMYPSCLLLSPCNIHAEQMPVDVGCSGLSAQVLKVPCIVNRETSMASIAGLMVS